MAQASDVLVQLSKNSNVNIFDNYSRG